MKERYQINPFEKEVEEYLHQNYPAKRAWVKKNLETLQSFRTRQNPMSDGEIVTYALQVTKDFAKHSGINLPDRRRDDTLHIPSRLAAIMKFEKDIPNLEKQLTLNGILEILVDAETTNIQRSIQFASSDRVLLDLENLTKLVNLHRKLIGV